jgi:tetratricopeptide (TPR) repeat protein
VGYCLLIGFLAGSAIAAFRDASAPLWRKLSGCAMIALAIVGGLYGFLTVMRNRDWRSRAALDAADLSAHPRSCKLLAQMGHSALERREPDVALDFAKRALAVHPGFASAWRISGLARWQQDDKDGALLDLKRSFELGGANDEQANVVVTDAFASRGDYRQAIGLLRRLVDINPLAATAHNNLAWYLITAEPADLRDPQAARTHAEQAVRLRPEEPEFLDTYVSVLMALDRKDEATRALRDRLPQIPETEPRRADLVKRLSELEH